MWCVVFWPESIKLLIRQAENSISGQESFKERSLVGSRFSVLSFWLFSDQLRKSPNLWVQKKIIKFRQSTQNAWLRPAKFLWKLFSDLPFSCFRNFVVVFFAIPGLRVFCYCLFPVFSCVSLKNSDNFLLFLNVAIILREKIVSCEDSFDFFSLTSRWPPLFMREKGSIIANS